MARFDSNKLELAVAEMISVSVGDQLSTEKRMIEGVIQEVPSVILARSMSFDGKPVIPPPYPFIMLETTGTTKSHDLITTYLDENGNQLYETTITARVNIKVIGTVNDYVDNIASDLEQAFNVEDYRDLIEQEYGGRCRWKTTSSPLTSSNTINDVYQEASSLDSYFSIVRTYTKINDGVLKSFNINSNFSHTSGDLI